MANLMLKVQGTCIAPIINSVSLNNNGYLVIDYTVNTTNLGSPEYQIATDASFTNIVNSRVGFTYTQQEVTFLLATGYSQLFIRARKHCIIQSGGTVPSNWSATYQWINTANQVLAPYEFNPVSVIPASRSTPIDSGKYTICSVGNEYTKGLKINTPVPQIGTKLYLTDGVTPAIPGNLSSFDVHNIIDFNSVGIRWVRFIYSAGGSDLYTKVWEVNPATGVILALSTYKCS